MPEQCVCHREVARLHQLFQEWFRGEAPDSAFDECERALAPDFTIVTPAGTVIERNQILAAIRHHRGGEPADFRIETVPRTCHQVRGLHISIYEEHQTGARATVRLSTAVIGEADDLMRWHSVHETWITTTDL